VAPIDPAVASRKRKRDTDDEGGNTTDKHTSDGGELDEEPDEGPDEEDEDVEDYSAPKPKTTKPKKQPAAAGASKMKAKAPSAKKLRTAKAKGATGARKGKADASVDVVKQIKDSHISDDNALFSTCSVSFLLFRARLIPSA
jgi:cohesin complex subunit SA-1/2